MSMGTGPLRFATFLAPSMYSVYEAIARHVGERLGVEIELAVGERFSEFAEGRADVGFICGLPYVRLREQMPPPVELLAAPVLQGERYGGRPVYFSDVIVRRDSPFHCFADLRARSWSYNDRDSHSGYGVTLSSMVQMGETHGFFRRVVEAGFHQESIRLVAAGEVDASAIDSHVLALALRDDPTLAERLRVIDTFGPSSIQPVVAACRLPDGLKSDLQAALLDMAHYPDGKSRLAGGLVERFVPVRDSDYDDIREMLRTAEQAGYLVVR
jgi:phosphonate transport system substrate-binding protein